ncbi:hypothetical protein BO70DRAFT_44274 [Aspergillus heteromorphus CBS 117.55]|uniref:Uncharacterized protein n=1 Tax=Aspergillus heteromorphus CBS 117.55 TaxID=1448321 RepID=A0A317W634_9EURO|nr:uncharacterized protein BO70DRAFT_44274 [Aspergillus heteromorphus CBS 117.55]PWY80478.1 hypothetical protein BO70DRAFT_44274 [Aspergillus heteromorphus CBS 117.55]
MIHSIHQHHNSIVAVSATAPLLCLLPRQPPSSALPSLIHLHPTTIPTVASPQKPLLSCDNPLFTASRDPQYDSPQRGDPLPTWKPHIRAVRARVARLILETPRQVICYGVVRRSLIVRGLRERIGYPPQITRHGNIIGTWAYVICKENRLQGRRYSHDILISFDYNRIGYLQRNISLPILWSKALILERPM